MDSGNLLWRMRNETIPLLPNLLSNPNFQKWPKSFNYYGFASWLQRTFCPLKPWMMVAKKVISYKCFNKIYIFCEKILKKWCPKCYIQVRLPWNWPLFNRQSRLQSEKYPFQPWLMVAKDIFSLSTVADNCKEDNIMGFSHYIYETQLNSENMCLPINLAKKSQFYDSLLQRIFFPLQPWLMVAKRIISWDFPIIFMKMSWLLKTCIYL